MQIYSFIMFIIPNYVYFCNTLFMKDITKNLYNTTTEYSNLII